MSNFIVGQSVLLRIGKSTFNRTVSEIINGTVYLAEGGDAFHAETGLVHGSKPRKFITNN